jgi:hypothetical protein
LVASAGSDPFADAGLDALVSCATPGELRAKTAIGIEIKTKNELIAQGR